MVLFFHDGLSDQIAVETDATGAVSTRYLVDSFGVARGKLDIGNSTGRSYYMTDPRANLTQMIGASDQALKAVFAYDPYGKDKTALSKKIDGTNWDSRLKFQMAPKDPKTGAYNIGARLLNPTINRFVGSDNYVAAAANLDLQVDPLTGNRYLYAGANPAGLIDNGHSWCQVTPAAGSTRVHRIRRRTLQAPLRVPKAHSSTATDRSCEASGANGSDRQHSTGQVRNGDDFHASWSGEWQRRFHHHVLRSGQATKLLRERTELG
ncbi:MAG: RHS repeat-associated core domain-containing protein [Actinomycetota bacterium]